MKQWWAPVIAFFIPIIVWLLFMGGIVFTVFHFVSKWW